MCITVRVGEGAPSSVSGLGSQKNFLGIYPSTSTLEFLSSSVASHRFMKVNAIVESMALHPFALDLASKINQVQPNKDKPSTQLEHLAQVLF